MDVGYWYGYLYWYLYQYGYQFRCWYGMVSVSVWVSVWVLIWVWQLQDSRDVWGELILPGIACSAAHPRRWYGIVAEPERLPEPASIQAGAEEAAQQG